jgi:hypothetical protein
LKRTFLAASVAPKYSIEEYRLGGEGFINWCEDFVYIPVYPAGVDIPLWMPMGGLPLDYGVIWEAQKEVAKVALQMREGRFIHKLLVFCWMRGEGKSLLTVLIQLWKFFCWPGQHIVFGANSKEQTKFVHYDIARDIILNSPKLIAIVGSRNIQEKHIRLLNAKGEISNVMRSISSFSGIVSNITGFTFSEIFDMKNPRFYTQLWGSIRNIPNSLGIIDSTVSAKTHILYKLYNTHLEKKDPLLFFSYRQSKLGDVRDYWNPNMTQEQLNSYKETFPFGEFERYFLNLWEGGYKQVFTDEMLEETKYIGVDGLIQSHDNIQPVVKDVLKGKQEQRSRLMPINTIYRLDDWCSISALNMLSDFYDTNWSIGVGFDRSDPMKANYTNARSIFTIIAKGLPGSRSNPFPFLKEGAKLKYLYIVLAVELMERNTLDEMKGLITKTLYQYKGVDSVCSERWGMWDLAEWCKSQNIPFEDISPTYEKQKSAFSELFNIYKEGMIKYPEVPIAGSKQDDIVREELSAFDHNVDKKWFGSLEKDEKHGIQDDSVYSQGWGIYGMRDFNVTHFRERVAEPYFGTFITNKDLVGSW